MSRTRRRPIAGNVWERMKKHYDHRCLCCRNKCDQLTQDHVVPLAEGGANDASNIQPLCKSCNQLKNRDIVDYRVFYPPFKV